ncbi:MAG: hypothetical protein QOF51_2072 [Chloroflexota bacterium]|jgi:hypothetical protein|nr:hypothetical protein [Chloroflexota bacterium]
MYVRDERYPIEVPAGVRAFPSKFHGEVDDVVCINGDDDEVITVVPLAIVLGWVYEQYRAPIIPRVRVHLRGRSEPIIVGAFVRPVAESNVPAPTPGWVCFSTLDERIVAGFREPDFECWEVIAGAAQHRD